MQNDKLINGLNGRGIKEEKLNIFHVSTHEDQNKFEGYTVSDSLMHLPVRD